MAAGDLILIKPIITQTITGVGSTTTHGLEHEQTLGTVLTGAPATATQAGAMRQMTFTAQLSAAPTQADFNSLLTKLIAAGHMAAS